MRLEEVEERDHPHGLHGGLQPRPRLLQNLLLSWCDDWPAVQLKLFGCVNLLLVWWFYIRCKPIFASEHLAIRGFFPVNFLARETANTKTANNEGRL